MSMILTKADFLSLRFALSGDLTPKQHVQLTDPAALLDYSEFLRSEGKPCWFIRQGLQGHWYPGLYATPRAAWQAAHEFHLATFRAGIGRAAA